MVRVVGSVAFDTLGRVSDLPRRNATSRIDSLATRFGGTAGNVAVALARLGEPVSLGTVVGPDFAASGYEARLRDLGVDLSDVVRGEDLTAHAFVWNDPSGSQATCFFPGASRGLARVPPRPTPLAHFSAGEVSAYPRHMEVADVVTFDPGQEVFHRDLAEITACLPFVDVLFLNEHERERLGSAAGFREADAFAAGVGAVVVTRGADGAEVRTPRGTEVVPSAPADPVDPTGAGDAHRSGFLLGLSRGLDFGASARLGAVLAAFAIESVGPQEGLPGLAAFRKRHEAAFGPCPV